MINKNSLRHFKSVANIPNTVLPDYQNYSFSNIIPAINYLLTQNQTEDNKIPVDCFKNSKYPVPEKVVLFFVDAYGWLFWDPEKGVKYPDFIKNNVDDIVITPITSIFPSSTAAAVNSINYGCSPSRHGIFDVRMYIKKFDSYIWTFNFEPVVDNKIEFKEQNFDIADMYLKKETNWEYLNAKNIDSYCFSPKKLSKTVFNQHGCRGSKIIGYETLSEGLTNLKEYLNSNEKGLFYFYIESIDILMHKYGTKSEQVSNEILSFWDSFDRVFGDWKKPANTTFMFTADHGQINTDPSDAFLLNEKIDNFDNYLKRTELGSLIYPVGSSRSSFLFVKEGLIDELYDILKSSLKNIALVLKTNEYISSGLIDSAIPSDEFIERLGDIQILPLDKNLVWYKQEGITKEKPGAHGGINKDEMLTQLITW